MWLLAGQKAPDHSTIARFRSGFWVLTIRVLPLIQDMKVKKGTAICGRRGSSHTSNLKPMKNGKKEFYKELRVICLKKQRSKSGYESEVTVYECEDCTGCPYIEKSRMSGLEAICLI